MLNWFLNALLFVFGSKCNIFNLLIFIGLWNSKILLPKQNRACNKIQCIWPEKNSIKYHEKLRKDLDFLDVEYNEEIFFKLNLP